MTAVALEIRRLDLADLDAIESIEQRAYPTPWSRSMFASELAKPTSICLGAFDGSDLVGYVINSRYVDAWHVMNVAVDPEHQRRGVATALLERLFELTRDDERRGYTLEVRVSNDGAIQLYEQLGFESRGIRRGYYTDNREDALIMWRDARARPGDDPRDRDVLRRDRRGARHRRRRDRVRTSSRRRPSCTRASAASCRRSPSRRHLELIVARDRRGARRRGGRARDLDAIAVTADPGLIGALLVGVSAAKALAWARRLPLIPVDHLHGHVASLYLKPLDLEPPFTCLLASGGHTMLARRAGARRLPRARDDARRRRRRGVRQGRAAARARLSGRHGDRRARAAGRPGRLRLPGRARRRASTSRSRA